MTLEQEIITWLEQQSVNLQIQDAPGRKALLIGAGLGDMQNAVIFGDATLVFCRNVVEYLWNYGQLADGRDPLVALLETAQTLVGTDKQAQCAALIDRLRGEERQPAQSRRSRGDVRRVMIACATLLALISLIAIGYYAISSFRPTPPPVTPAATPSPESRIMTTTGDDSPIIQTESGDVTINFQQGFQNYSGGTP